MAKCGDTIVIEITNPSDISLDVLKRINELKINVSMYHFYDNGTIRFFRKPKDFGGDFGVILEMAKALKKFDVSLDFPMDGLRDYIKAHPEDAKHILIPDSNKSIINLDKIDIKDYEENIIPINFRDLEKIDLEKFKQGDNSIRLVITSAAELSAEQIKSLQEKGYPIKEICVFDKGNGIRQNAPYELDTYLEVRAKLEELVEGIDLSLSEGERFAEVYRRVGKFISYDTPVAYPKTEEERAISERDATTSRNLVNGLLKGKTVCAGYADILRNALSLVGIEAHYVSGKVIEGDISLLRYKMGKYDKELGTEVDEKRKKVTLYEAHAWNKVKIDGVWYNVDVTYDSDRMKRGVLPKSCLKTDAEIFKSDKKTKFDGPECVTKMELQDIAKLFGDEGRFFGNIRILSPKEFVERLKKEMEIFSTELHEEMEKIHKAISKSFGKSENILPPTPILKEANREKKEPPKTSWDLENWGAQSMPSPKDFLKNYQDDRGNKTENKKLKSKSVDDNTIIENKNDNNKERE